MKFANVISTAGEWLRGEGPHHQIVISSRVRLARNVRNRAFPGWAKKAERTPILGIITGPFRPRKTGAGGASFDQSRTCRQKRGQRDRDESPPNPQCDDQ